MIAWSVTIAAAAFVILSAVMIGVLMNVRAFIKQLRGSMERLEEDVILLTEDAAKVLRSTDHTVLNLQEHIQKSAAFMESVEAAGTVLRSTTQRVENISSSITHSVQQHVQHAHEENQERMGAIFRSIDAALTVWSSIQRFSKTSGDSSGPK